MNLRAARFWASLLIVGWVLAQGAAAADDPAADAKLPVPTEAELATARPQVDNHLKDDLSAAKTPDQKSALAKKLIDTAKDSRLSPGERYGILLVALDQATLANNAELVMTVADAIAGHFQRDVVDIATEPLGKIAKTMPNGPAARKAADQIYVCLEGAIELRQYGKALALNASWLAAARKAQDPAYLKAVTERNKSIIAMKPAWDAIEPTLKTLAKSPHDPQATTALGRFLCLVEGNWPDGLEMLVQGADPTLAQLAAETQQAMADHASLSKVAEAWWNLAQAAKGAEKIDYQAAAYTWNLKTLTTATGPDRIKAEAHFKTLGGFSRPLSFYQAQRERRAALWAIKMGGQAHVLQTGSAQPSGFGTVETVPYTNFVVTEIVIDETRNGALKKVDDEELKNLRGLIGMQKLVLRETGMTDAGVKHLGDLTTLTHLDIGNSYRITDDSADDLCKLVNLQTLDIIGAGKLKDPGVIKLCGPLKQLADLNLSGRIGDTAMPYLKNLSQLRKLSLNGCKQITDGGLKHLVELKNLEDLNVGWIPLSDAAVRQLAQLKQLKKLSLQMTGITDQNIGYLAELKNLNYIYLDRVKASPASIKKLQQALPNLGKGP